MELDQWKDIWKEENTSPSKDAQKLQSLLEKKSRSPVAKMKRNLTIELWVILITYGAMILFYFVAFKGKLSEVSWFMLFIGLLFVLYYQRKNKLLSEMECLSCQVKSNLEKQTHMLEKYIRFYLIAGTVMAPLSLIFFAWLFYTKATSNVHDTIFYPSAANPWWKVILAWSIFSALLTILLYFINKWYVRKLYGKHVEKLKEILCEMEND